MTENYNPFSSFTNEEISIAYSEYKMNALGFTGSVLKASQDYQEWYVETYGSENNMIISTIPIMLLDEMAKRFDNVLSYLEEVEENIQYYRRICDDIDVDYRNYR